MNSYMNIMVRVVSNQAQARLAALRATQQGLTTDMVAAGRTEPLGRRHLSSLMKFGNQLQWTGRMLQYNFTLPIAAAGIAATKFYMDQEKAMTHVAKVYGDTEEAAKQFRREQGLGRQAAMDLAESYKTDELEALDRAFTAMSNHYAVQKTEVLEVAGAWAAAGQSGEALARSVDATMKAIIIGDMDAAAATKALISIQAQYNMSSEDLMKTLANLNSVENQTGASMQDLITGFEKAAGVARSAGVPAEELAAHIAALVPASGSAANAGNALKTIYSRLIAPTKETTQVLGAMGFATDTLAWNSATAGERLKLMAGEFEGMGASAKNAASSVIASRWQVNRFDILMRELTNDAGYYAKAMQAAEHQGESFRRMQDELNTVLESDPKALSRVWVMIQNAMVKVIIPVIPYILYLADSVADLATSFANLDPYLQKFVLLGLAVLAFIGPLIRYGGALFTLFGVGLVVVQALGGAFLGLVGILLKVFTPIRMLGTVLMGVFGLLPSLFTMAGAATVAGMRGVSAAFAGAWAVMSAITKIGWAVQIGIWKAAFATKLLMAKLFWVKLRTLWLAMQIFNVGIWAAMWTAMAGISSGGMKAILAGVVKFGRAFAVALTGPIGIAIAVVVGVLYAFREQIAQIWNNIVSYFAGEGGSIGDIFVGIGKLIMGVFNSLPQGVQNAMVAVVTIVRDAALAVYDWFSYINPFARHSPSLVENVENGMARVVAGFGTLSQIKKYTNAAYAEIKRFGELTSKLGVSQQAAEQRSNRKTLSDAGAGQALGSYNKLVGILNKLTPALKMIETRMNAQQAVVDAWQKKIDSANRSIERQEKRLDSLQDKLAKYKDRLSEAQDDLSRFSSAPLEGMRAMENQIFRNEMAQTRLRWEMMKFEDVNGTFDQIKSKIDAINGAQEVLRGTQASLRSQGAGSEILGQYDKELSKLDQQKDKYAEAADKLADMQASLDKLQREAERLDLVKAMKFDELQHRIDAAANSMEELSFDEIMAGIREANKQIEKYGPLVDKAAAAAERQQKVVDRQIAARDQLQSRLDREQQTLDRIKERYDSVNDAIQAIESSLSDVMSAADAANAAMEGKKKKGAKGGEEYISPGLQNFLDAGNAGFPDVGGGGIPMRTDWTSQADEIDKFAEQMAFDTASLFEDLNPFTPLKGKAIEFWNWLKGRASETVQVVKGFFSNILGGVNFGGADNPLSGLTDTLKNVGEFMTEVIRDIAKPFKWAWDLLGPEIKKIGKGIWDGLKAIWEKVGPELAAFGDLISPMGEAISNVWDIIKPVLALIVVGILGALKVIGSIVGETIGPLLDAVATILGGVVRVIRGFVEIVTGILTGDFSMVWDGIVDIVGGTFEAIWGIIKGAVALIWNPIKGLVKGIYGFFVWLWDVLVGHSVIPDIVEGIIFWFKKLVSIGQWIWNNVILPIAGFFKKMFDMVIAVMSTLWGGIQIAWTGLKTAANWVWDNVLKPVVDFFVAAWDGIKEGAGLLWEGIKAAWSGLATAGQWVWDNVLKPVLDQVKTLWRLAKEVFKGWWAGVQAVWAGFKNAGQWIWNNVLKNVLQKVRDLWRMARDVFKIWWSGIQTVWAGLKNAGQWMWNNVLKPVLQKVKDVWVDVRTNLKDWWENIKQVWNGLTKLGDWFHTNVMKPVFDTVKSVWQSIKTWLTDNKDMLTAPMKGIVNVVIDAVNAIVKGLNKVADILPGVDWEIGTIPRLAQGGDIPARRVGNGFKTNGARAIVGEGKANHPEFVIPTDPTYRNRAKGLLMMAAAKLGMGEKSPGGDMSDVARTMKDMAKTNPMGREGAVPEFGIGGWLGDRWGDLKGLAGQVSKLGKRAVGTVMNPVLDAADSKVRGVGWPPVEAPPRYGISKLRDWVRETDASVAEGQKQAEMLIGGGPNVQRALAWAKTQVGRPYQWSGSGNPGWDCSGFMGAITNVYRGQPPGRLGATGNFPWAGFKAGVGPAKGFTIGSTPKYPGSDVGHMSGTLGGVNVESTSGVGVRIGPSARGWNDPGYTQVYHLAKGGIAKAKRGGVLARIGEGGYDEAVTPLPKNWRNQVTPGVGNESGSKTYHFHGDLSFPNITDPNDAQTFLDNLDAIAKD